MALLLTWPEISMEPEVSMEIVAAILAYILICGVTLFYLRGRKRDI
jgi:hypothetical protein